jgi:dTDP-glucose pyrophosphorylase
LLAKKFINNEDSLIIANSDQYIEWDPIDFLYFVQENKADGGILTFESMHPKWSYAKLDENGNVTEIAEKKVISNLATVGIYWYKRGCEYINYAEQMIKKDIRVNGEFYVAPIFNEYIQDGKKILTYNVNKMQGLGTPEDLESFINNL